MAMIQPPGYIWRGQTYKTIMGFIRAVDRVYPNKSITFLTYTVSVRRTDGSIIILARTFDADGNSVIADL